MTQEKNNFQEMISGKVLMRNDTTEPGERKPKETKNRKTKMERTEMICFNGSQKKNDLHSGQKVDVCVS